MEISITNHAKERMEKYQISESDVKETINNPTNTSIGYSNRTIFQGNLNGYVLRVICEKVKNTIVVITIYKTKRGRYEI